MKQLHSLRATEVSLVPKGANGKRFAILKEQEEHDLSVKKAIEQVKSTPASMIDKIKKALKSFGQKPEEGGEAGAQGGQQLSREAQTALEATGRILLPHKDEITDAHLDAVQEQIGIGSGTGQGPDENAEQDAEEGTVKPADMSGAMEAAKKAYKEHLEKLGYQKYPEGELTMKAKKPGSEMEPDEDDAEGEDDEGDDVSKENKTVLPVMKEDGSLNLAAVPEEMRPFMEVVSKEMIASKGRADAAEQRAVKLEKQLSDNQIASRKAEIATIAKGLTNLDTAHVAKVLEKFDGDKEGFDSVLKGFEAQNAQAAESGLFKTIGSAMSDKAGGQSSDIMSKVEKAVGEIVQKSTESGKPITKEQAMTDYLMKHPELYEQEKGRRAAAHPSGA